MIKQINCESAATGLHDYLVKTHWNGLALKGPDPGIRFNARFGRFVKSSLSFLPWSDNIAYAQAQKYWIASNWLMADLGLADKSRCQEMAVACSEYLLTAQRPEGYWEHPNREWKDRIASVEGNYAAMGLLDSFLRTGDDRFLSGAQRWFRFATQQIGFRGHEGRLAINYFAKRGTAMVPNVSASAVRTFALLAKASGDEEPLEYCRGMLRWLNEVQMPSGELPYAVASPDDPNRQDRIHFLCQQYNAFQFLNLADYYGLTEDLVVWPVLENLADFVHNGITGAGACRYDCHHETPEIPYYSAAVAAALHRATDLAVGDYRDISDRVYQRVLSQQCPDGSFSFYSTGNYGFLTDRRSYPRYLSMILYLILLRLRTFASVNRTEADVTT